MIGLVNEILLTFFSILAGGIVAVFGIFSVKKMSGNVRRIQIGVCGTVALFSIFHPYSVAKNIDKYTAEISWQKVTRVTNPDFVTSNLIGNSHLGLPLDFRAEEKKSVILIVLNEDKSKFLLLGSLVASGKKSLMLEMDGQLVEIDRDKIYASKHLSHAPEGTKLDLIFGFSILIFLGLLILFTNNISLIPTSHNPFNSYRIWINICNLLDPIQFMSAAFSFYFALASLFICIFGVSARNAISSTLAWSPVAAGIFLLAFYTRMIFQIKIVEHKTFLGASTFLRSIEFDVGIGGNNPDKNQHSSINFAELDIFTHATLSRIKEACLQNAEIQSSLLFLGLRLLRNDVGYLSDISNTSVKFQQSHNENKKILNSIFILLKIGYLKIIDNFRFELTSEGLEAQALPSMLFVQQIPRKFQYQLAQARDLLNNGNYSAALGKCNREIFEPFLRFFLSQQGEFEVRKIIDEINKGRKGEKIQSLSHATSGQLKDRVANYLKNVQDKDVKTKALGLLDALMGLMSAINDIRNETSHFRDISESEKRAREGENAMFQIELLRIFMHIICTRVIDQRQVNPVEKLAEDQPLGQ